VATRVEQFTKQRSFSYSILLTRIDRAQYSSRYGSRFEMKCCTWQWRIQCRCRWRLWALSISCHSTV